MGICKRSRDRPEIELNYMQRFPRIYTALIKSFLPFFSTHRTIVTQQYGISKLSIFENCFFKRIVDSGDTRAIPR